LSYPETRRYSFNPLKEVFCKSLVEFFKECVLELFLA